MPSIRCLNGPAHTHETVAESRACWTGGPAHSTVQPDPIQPASKKQLDFIEVLGGDVDKARQYNMREASNYITQLKQARNTLRSGSLQVTQPSKLEIVAPLLSAVPDGYFAVQMDTEAKMHFVRISTVKLKTSANFGCRHIQTIHGPALDIAVRIYADGKVREYKDVTDAVMLIIADYQGAALRYAKEIGKCCRCNTRLTSDWRKVGVGPECVKYFGWAVERANEQTSS